MLTIRVVLSDLKLFLWKKMSKKVRKNWVLKFRNPAKNRVFNFFSFFLLHNHRGIILDRIEKTAPLYLVSFYLISEKPQKPPNSRENREYLENPSINFFETMIFVISAKNWFRNVCHLFWGIQSPKFVNQCYLLYIFTYFLL